MRSALRTTLIVVATILLTTLFTNAVDVGGGINRSLVSSVIGGSAQDDGACPEDMVEVPAEDGSFCLDQFEASPSERCPFQDPRSSEESELNISTQSCSTQSVKGAIPWRNATLAQAQALCAKEGKRLPTAQEWYLAALGTPDREHPARADCNLAQNWGGGIGATGSGANCRSGAGAFDMVGNVWEWVDETVDQGVVRDVSLPEAGYITEVDNTGLPRQTDHASSSAVYHHDRLWLSRDGVRGIMRGGYYQSRSDGGVYALFAASPPSFSGEALGFRCAM